ncbi:lactate racemase domain-containing protein [Natrarchaeobius sp. A-rgal3]|uniref:lactate racemase domain-containing protein n=1 Tax=Natrarchaeobius versutus TaxID=1679078 RepID=UPI00350F0F55
MPNEIVSDIAVQEETIQRACGSPTLPEFGVIEQRWETDPIPDDEIADRASEAVTSLPFEDVPEGGTVALGVGSRGIDALSTIVEGVVRGVRDLGFDPIVVPAMGSHGGATAEGQQEKLAALGVTEESVGCEIRATMDVTQVGETPERGVPLYFDAIAAEADAIVPINRIKPHTDFDGSVESGLSKMIVIGLGKQRGAKMAHDWAVDWSFRNMIPEIGSQLLDELPIVGGVAIVEDEHDETTLLEGIPPEGFLDREEELLEMAYDRMPTLPFEEVDVLVVDELGKDISGQGIDTNVIGRRPFTINEPEPERPDVKRIYVRGLTPKTKGNAMGVGSADLIHRDVFANVDTSKSLINAMTASTVRGVRLPPVVETDRAGLTAALSTIGVVDPEDARVLRVSDTMHLKRAFASPALVEEARERDDLTVVAEPEPIAFENGAFVEPIPEPSESHP